MALLAPQMSRNRPLGMTSPPRGRSRRRPGQRAPNLRRSSAEGGGQQRAATGRGSRASLVKPTPRGTRVSGGQATRKPAARAGARRDRASNRRHRARTPGEPRQGETSRAGRVLVPPRGGPGGIREERAADGRRGTTNHLDGPGRPRAVEHENHGSTSPGSRSTSRPRFCFSRPRSCLANRRPVSAGRELSTTGADMPKAHPVWGGPSVKGCPAASYSPTPSPGQYHRR